LYYIDKQLPILGALPNFIGIHRLWRAETLFIDALFIATKKEVEMLQETVDVNSGKPGTSPLISG